MTSKLTPSSKQLTPSQAFIHIVALWPNVNRIEKYTNSRVYLHYDMEGEQRRIQRYMPCIDWGTAKEYPVKEVWRDATIQDVTFPFRKALLSDVGSNDLTTWMTEYKLAGFTYDADGTIIWMDDEGDTWRYCKVLDDCPSPDGQPIETFNLPLETDCLLFMGGEWLRGWKSRGSTPFLSRGHNRSMNWDRQNQPTRWKPLNGENPDLIGATPISQFDTNDCSTNYLFFMGGVWRSGRMRSNGTVYTNSQSSAWDKANPPTHFKLKPSGYIETQINEDDC